MNKQKAYKLFIKTFGPAPPDGWDYEDWLNWKQLEKAFLLGLNYHEVEFNRYAGTGI